MARTTTDPRNGFVRMRITESEGQRLRKSAEALGTTRTKVLMRGLALVEAEIEQQKRQAPSESKPA